MMRKFLAFPPWLIIRAIPLPKGHPWQHKQRSFAWWHRGATEHTLCAGAVLWACAFNLVMLGVRIWWLHAH